MRQGRFDQDQIQHWDSQRSNPAQLHVPFWHSAVASEDPLAGTKGTKQGAYKGTAGVRVPRVDIIPGQGKLARALVVCLVGLLLQGEACLCTEAGMPRMVGPLPVLEMILAQPPSSYPWPSTDT